MFRDRRRTRTPGRGTAVGRAEDPPDVGAPARGGRLDTVRQHHRRHPLDVVERDPVTVLVGRERLGGLPGDEVGAVPVDLQLDAEVGDGDEDLPVDDDVSERRHRPPDALGLGPLHGFPAVDERFRVILEGLPTLDDLRPLADVADPLHVDAEAETIEQLGAQLPLLRVHRPDQDEARRVRDGDALALDGVGPHRRRVEEDVDDVVVEQVDLVHVQDVPVGVGENSRLEFLLALLDGRLDVDGADDAVLRRVDGGSTTRIWR